VPTDSDEVVASSALVHADVPDETLLTATWAGGINGRQVIDRFIPVAAELLAPQGLLFLLLIRENQPDDVCALCGTSCPFDGCI
jgi:hypothetical protein